jgi:hypothetical protein
MLTAGEAGARLSSIRQRFKPEFLNLEKRAGFAWNTLKEKFSANAITPEQKQEPEAEDTVESRLKALEEANNRYQKQLKDKEDFINQRNAEVGLLRKQLRDKRTSEAEAELTDEEILEDPKAAVKKAIERAKEREALEEEQRQESLEQLKTVNAEALKRFVPDFENKRDHILEVLQQEAPTDIVEAFKADPTTVLHPSLIFQLAKRAEAMQEIKNLKAQVEELKQKPGKLVDTFNKYGQAKSPVASAQTPAPKATRKLDSLTVKDIDNMSLEQLKELEKQITSN